jgi:chromosome transmission fidelity protein 4
MDKELIKIIQLACKAGSLQRALDTAMLLHYPQSFDGASAIAKFYHFVGLEEKIQLVKEHVLQSRRREEDRAHRRTWAKHADPVAAPIRPTYESGVSTFAAPAAPARKPIALAKPIVAEPTSSSRAARLDDDWDFDLMNDESQIEPSSNKRKYVEEETQSSETAAEASNSRKRIQPSHTSQTSQSTEVPKPGEWLCPNI